MSLANRADVYQEKARWCRCGYAKPHADEMFTASSAPYAHGSDWHFSSVLKYPLFGR